MGFKPGAPSCIEREGGNYRPQRNSSTSFRIKFEQEREEEQQQRVLAALIFSSSCFAFSSLFLGICLFSSLLFHVLLPLGSPLYEIPFSFYEAAAAAIAATWRWDPQRERERELGRERNPPSTVSASAAATEGLLETRIPVHTTHNTKLERN